MPTSLLAISPPVEAQFAPIYGVASDDFDGVIEGQVRDMKWLRSADGGLLIVVARNGDALQILRPLRSSGPIDEKR